MSWFERLLSRRRLYGELSEEIQAHLEERVEELVAGGMARQEASYAVRREGDYTRRCVLHGDRRRLSAI